MSVPHALLLETGGPQEAMHQLHPPLLLIVLCQQVHAQLALLQPIAACLGPQLAYCLADIGELHPVPGATGLLLMVVVTLWLVCL